MKRTVYLLALFLLLFAFGCSELPPTGPAGVDKELSKPNTQEIIKIDNKVEDPLYGFTQVIGELNCYHELVGSQSDNNNNVLLVRVQLDLNAQLYDRFGKYHLDWRVSGENSSLVFVPEGEAVLLKITYPIYNRDDSVLIVQYRITTDGVDISKMWLEPVK